MKELRKEKKHEKDYKAEKEEKDEAMKFVKDKIAEHKEIFIRLRDK